MSRPTLRATPDFWVFRDYQWSGQHKYSSFSFHQSKEMVRKFLLVVVVIVSLILIADYLLKKPIAVCQGFKE